MTRRTDTRRAVLKLGAGVGLAGVGALSGCLGGGDGDSDDSGDGDGDGGDDGSGTDGGEVGGSGPTTIGRSTPTPLPPTASFNWDYSSDGSLSVRMEAGEQIRAAYLYVRGEAGSAETGRWDSLGGSASGTHDGDAAVTAGDGVTLSDVPMDYQLSLVWETPDGFSTTLDEDQGPDA